MTVAENNAQKNRTRQKKTTLPSAVEKILSIFNGAEDWNPKDPNFRPVLNKTYKVKRPMFVESYPVRVKDQENYRRNGKTDKKKRHFLKFRLVSFVGENNVLIAGRKFRPNGTLSERRYCAEIPLKGVA